VKGRKGEGPETSQRSPLPDLHELVLENAHEAIAVGQDGRIISCNHKTEEITGYSRAELYAMPFGALVHPEDRAVALERNRQREAGGSIPTYTFRALRKDGGVRFVEVKGVTIDWQGRPGTLTFFSDVTEREAARQALLESERFKERVADATPGILYIYDLEERRNVYVNREVTTALGYDATDFQAIGETFLTDLPGIGSVCSGGRYDNLASLYTKQLLPGVGASLRDSLKTRNGFLHRRSMDGRYRLRWKVELWASSRSIRKNPGSTTVILMPNFSASVATDSESPPPANFVAAWIVDVRRGWLRRSVVGRIAERVKDRLASRHFRF
jgi:PAS domain S-box-containing protein